MILGSITRGTVPRVGRGKQDEQSGELKEAGLYRKPLGQLQLFSHQNRSLEEPPGEFGHYCRNPGGPRRVD